MVGETEKHRYGADGGSVSVDGVFFPVFRPNTMNDGTITRRRNNVRGLCAPGVRTEWKTKRRLGITRIPVEPSARRRANRATNTRRISENCILSPENTVKRVRTADKKRLHVARLGPRRIRVFGTPPGAFFCLLRDVLVC